MYFEFVKCDDHTGRGLATTILEIFGSNQIDLSNMMGRKDAMVLLCQLPAKF